MNRTSARVLAVALPFGAVATIAVALLWTIGAIPRVPVASEIVGLVAVLLAPGLAVEPSFHGERWTLLERLGLATALSLALTALLGVGLHVAGLPVSPANVLGLLLVAVVPVGALSIRFRRGRRPLVLPRAMRLDIIVGLGSLALLAAGFVAIVVLRPVPQGPRLEIMAVDAAGRLVSMPIQSAAAGTTLTVDVRSASGDARSASLAIDGDGIRPWSSQSVQVGTGWTSFDVPIQTTRSGTLSARMTARSGGTELTLALELAVAP